MLSLTLAVFETRDPVLTLYWFHYCICVSGFSYWFHKLDSYTVSKNSSINWLVHVCTCLHHFTKQTPKGHNTSFSIACFFTLNRNLKSQNFSQHHHVGIANKQVSYIPLRRVRLHLTALGVNSISWIGREFNYRLLKRQQVQTHLTALAWSSITGSCVGIDLITVYCIGRFNSITGFCNGSEFNYRLLH